MKIRRQEGRPSVGTETSNADVKASALNSASSNPREATAKLPRTVQPRSGSDDITDPNRPRWVLETDVTTAAAHYTGRWIARRAKGKVLEYNPA